MAEIGIVGQGPAYALGADGTLGVLGGPTVLDWWVGAEDRWHTASTEAAVRQALAADDTTIETRLRVPGGDVVQRVVAVPDHGQGVAMVEIENATPVPVAIALTLEVRGAVRVFDDTVAADGSPVLRASRSVARMLVAEDRKQLEQGVAAGAARPPAEADPAWAGTHLAVIFPLPHTAVLRVAVPLVPVDELSTPADLPPIEAVARGWSMHTDRGADFSLPDPRMATVVGAARRHLLVGSTQPMGAAYWTHGVEPWVPAVAAVALDLWGHHIEARELLLAAVGSDDLLAHAGRGVAEAGSLLWAWAETLERHADPVLEPALVPWIEQAAIGLLGRRGGGLLRRRADPVDQAWRAVGLAAAGSLLTRAGNETLGPDIVDALPDLTADGLGDALSPAAALGGHRLGRRARGALVLLEALFDASPLTLTAVAGHADPSGSLPAAGRSHHPLASALMLLAVRQGLVDEPEGTGGVVALLGGLDPDWLGAPVEGHRFPVTGGRVSFGARWHGERPALLWDLEAGVAGRRLSAPALDPAWSADEPRGEALLGPTPSLATEAAPESPRVRRGEVIDPGDTPDSFA